MTGTKLYALIFAVGSLVGLAAGWGLWRPAKPALETPAPAVRQADSSLVLGRAPDASAKAPALVPTGEKVERIDKVIADHGEPVIVHDTVKVPMPSGPPETVVKVDTVTPPPIEVDLTTTVLKDGSHRVIASSPNGRIFSGVDIPVTNTTPPRVFKNALGATYDALNGSWTGLYSRDVKGPFRALVEATPKHGAVPARFALGLSIVF